MLTPIWPRVDWQVNDKNLLTGRWAYHYSNQPNGTFDVNSWGSSANAIEKDWAHGFTLNLLSTINSRMLNEFRGQYAKEWRPRPYDGPQVPGQNRPFPDTGFNFVNSYRGGLPFFIPVEYDDDRLQLVNNVSYLMGDHSLKAGIEFNDVTSSQTFVGFANGRYIFNSFDGFQQSRRQRRLHRVLRRQLQQFRLLPWRNHSHGPDPAVPAVRRRRWLDP